MNATAGEGIGAAHEKLVHQYGERAITIVSNQRLGKFTIENPTIYNPTMMVERYVGNKNQGVDTDMGRLISRHKSRSQSEQSAAQDLFNTAVRRHENSELRSHTIKLTTFIIGLLYIVMTHRYGSEEDKNETVFRKFIMPTVIVGGCGLLSGFVLAYTLTFLREIARYAGINTYSV